MKLLHHSLIVIAAENNCTNLEDTFNNNIYDEMPVVNSNRPA